MRRFALRLCECSRDKIVLAPERVTSLRIKVRKTVSTALSLGRYLFGEMKPLPPLTDSQRSALVDEKLFERKVRCWCGHEFYELGVWKPAAREVCCVRTCPFRQVKPQSTQAESAALIEGGNDLGGEPVVDRQPNEASKRLIDQRGKSP